MKFDKLAKSYEKVLKSLYNHFGLSDAGQAAPQVRSKKLLGTNWRSLPNVRKFTVQIQENNSLFELLGLDKRNRPRIEWEPYKNKALNRYAVKQLLRLKRHAHNNPQRFFKISYLLLRKSWVFRVMAMNHVFPNWHRTMAFSYVLKLNRKVNKLIDSRSTDLVFFRVYIPKSDGRQRPLGVPKKEWRLYLHMVNNMLQLYLTERQAFLPTMHGYQPNKGVLSAWQDFFERKIHESKFIFEFDLSNFFNSVKHIYMRAQLEDYDVPSWMVKWCMTLNKRVPIMPPKEELDESQFKARPSPSELKSNVWFETVSEKDAQLRKVLYRDGKYVIPHPNTGKFKEANERRLRVHDIFGPGHFNVGTRNEFRTHVGVGQGTPTGPLLSTMCLKEFLSQQPSLSYADDGIFYSNSPFNVRDGKVQIPVEVLAKVRHRTIQDYPFWGITINPTKSGWVKQKGKWLKPLKFLGLEYHGETQELWASTRKGSKLKLGQGVSAWIQALEKVEAEQETLGEVRAYQTSTARGYYTWENVMKSKYIGYLQSRLFYGKWNITDMHQDFSYNYGEQSWSSLTRWRYVLEDMTVFNSSSFASYSLVAVLTRKFGKGVGPKYYFKDDGRVRYVIV